MISVIIPLYNERENILKTINSVLSQSYRDIEIVVVDDGSTDDCGEVVKAIVDSRVSYYYKSNGGVSSARNYGIAKAKGEWLLFLDADDELQSGALSIFVELTERFPKCKLFAGQTMWRQNGKVLNKYNPPKNVIITHFPFFTIWRNVCMFGTSNMLVHRFLIEKYGGYDERMSFFEDWHLSLRMSRSGCFVCTGQNVSIYNQDGNGLSCSKHPLEKEMAYYIPEMLKGSTFFERALYYENIEFEKFYWREEPDKVRFYEEMQRKHFSRIHSILHWIRQKFIV